ncbi:MAG: outer membrane beta-barrel protein [Bacteroidetes bacterium]|nr:outer membrane beta-barrel protein [Bacteroidota bacterium]
MENSSYKQIREKLSSTEFPFDPQAWEQMEAMLDEKKKRRGFFWWWTGGIAAVLLLSIGILGWGVYLMEADDKQVVEIADGRPQTAAENDSDENKLATLSSRDETRDETSSTKQENTNTPVTLESNKNANSKKQEQNIEAKSKNKKQKAEANSKAVTSSRFKSEEDNHSTVLINANPHHARGNVFSKQVVSTSKHKNKTQTTRNSQLATRNQQPVTPIQNEIEMLNAPALRNNSTAENILLARREAEFLQSISDKAETGFDKKEEDALPKKKKQIFHYSLGVLANVTGTTLGNQPGNQPKRPPLFYSTPSYMVGFTHDFLFVNRIAITNSILFSQTSFKVYYPRTIDISRTPVSYTSHITELAIPIGIKIYAVVKNNFRFYINAGIVNHIKLKETFDYAFDADTSTSFVASIADNSTFPSQTNFAPEAASINRTTSGNSNSTQDFSINNAKRYYTSFYASAGFEFIAKKHFVLFAEPTFYMGLQKIGVQEKRKYNLGLSGGFRYQF